MSLFCAKLLPGQDGREPVNLVRNPLALHVESKIAPSCGATISAAAVQEAVESQLRLGGIAVSRVHTARLATEVDCTPLRIGGRTAAMGVQQCLGLSEVVSIPSAVRGLAFATTWRKCSSLRCARGKCEPLMQSQRQGLVDEFIAHFRALSATGLQVKDAGHREQVAAVEKRVPAQLESDHDRGRSRDLITTPPPSFLTAANVFYSVYILTCFAVLGYWEHHKQRFAH
jgi:hypothetical protein